VIARVDGRTRTRRRRDEPLTVGEHLAHGSDLAYLAIHPQAMSAVYEPREVPENMIAGGVGIMYVRGELDNLPSFWGWMSGGTDYQSIQQRFYDLLGSPDVNAIVMVIGSPGGNAEGLNATVDAMLRRRKRREARGKPVFGYFDDGAYSAAYAIAQVCDELYIPPAGGAGSIGVVARMCSYQGAYRKAGLDVRLITSGKRKGDGNPDADITPEAVAHVRAHVMKLARVYWQLVATRRGLSVSEVRALEANTFYGQDAVDVGLVDDIMSLEDVMRYAARVAARRASAATTSRA
jgi:ClpP class serine protease